MLSLLWSKMMVQEEVLRTFAYYRRIRKHYFWVEEKRFAGRVTRLFGQIFKLLNRYTTMNAILPTCAGKETPQQTGTHFTAGRKIYFGASSSSHDEAITYGGKLS